MTIPIVLGPIVKFIQKGEWQDTIAFTIGEAVLGTLILILHKPRASNEAVFLDYFGLNFRHPSDLLPRRESVNNIILKCFIGFPSVEDLDSMNDVGRAASENSDYRDDSPTQTAIAINVKGTTPTNMNTIGHQNSSSSSTPIRSPDPGTMVSTTIVNQDKARSSTKAGYNYTSCPTTTPSNPQKSGCTQPTASLPTNSLKNKSSTTSTLSKSNSTTCRREPSLRSPKCSSELTPRTTSGDAGSRPFWR